MNEILFRQLLNESEGTRLDIKRQQYSFVSADERAKSKLLKDLLVFANAWRSEPAYILIGVGEGPAGKRDLIGITEADHIDDASLQQFVQSKLNKTLTFSYRPFTYKGQVFGVLEIPVQERPFYAKSDFGIVKKDVIYYRLGSSCAVASPELVAQMGRDDAAQATDSPLLDIQFADLELDELRGHEFSVQTRRHELHGSRAFPDFEDEPSTSFTIWSARKEYWRELAEYTRDHRRFVAIRLGVTNSSPTMASSVLIKVSLPQDGVDVWESQELPEYPESHFSLKVPAAFPSALLSSAPLQGEISIARRGETWELVAELPSVRPRETAVPPSPIYIACEGSSELELAVTCYAAELGEPIHSTLFVNAEVKQLPELTMEELENLRLEHFDELARRKGWIEGDDLD